MADKTNNQNSAEKLVEVSLKTPSHFYGPSNLQPQESCQDHSMQDIFLKLVFTPCKAEQLLQVMELQEKEAQKVYSQQEICLERTYS